MPIPKFAYSLSLLAFLLPFLLVTCNNTKTKELKPLVMQDQMVYTIQGYKIIINSFDKSATDKEDSARNSLFGNKYENNPFSSFSASEEEPDYAEKWSMKRDWMRLLLALSFLLVLTGLVFQFFLKHESVRKKASVIVAGTTSALLLSFYISLEMSLGHTQDKVEEALGGDNLDSIFSSLSNIEPEIGLGSGFYICLLGQLIVLYYYLFFIKRYTLIKNTEEQVAPSTITDKE